MKQEILKLNRDIQTIRKIREEIKAEFASLGGKARAAKLSKARRLEISRLANKAKSLRRPKKAV